MLERLDLEVFVVHHFLVEALASDLCVSLPNKLTLGVFVWNQALIPWNRIISALIRRLN